MYQSIAKRRKRVSNKMDKQANKQTKWTSEPGSSTSGSSTSGGSSDLIVLTHTGSVITTHVVGTGLVATSLISRGDKNRVDDVNNTIARRDVGGGYSGTIDHDDTGIIDGNFNVGSLHGFGHHTVRQIGAHDLAGNYMVEQDIAEGGNAVLLEEGLNGPGGKGIEGIVGGGCNKCVVFCT